MYSGPIVFTQVMDFMPLKTFQRCVERYQGNFSVKHFTCCPPAQEGTRKLRIFLGRIIRDIKRKCQAPDQNLSHLLTLSERIFNQTRNDTNKVYSVHAP